MSIQSNILALPTDLMVLQSMSFFEHDLAHDLHPSSSTGLARATNVLYDESKIASTVEYMQQGGGIIEDLTQELNNICDMIRNKQMTEIEGSTNLNNLIIDTVNRVTEEDDLARAIDESLRTAPAYKQTISEKGLSEIKLVIYDPNIHQNDKCPITLEELSSQHQNSKIAELPCKHIALHDDLILWLKENPVCPICRHKMDSIEEKILQEEAMPDEAMPDEAMPDEANEVDVPSPPPHPNAQTLENYPTQSTILNTLLYLNYNDDEDVVNQRNAFMRNLNRLNRLNPH